MASMAYKTWRTLRFRTHAIATFTLVWTLLILVVLSWQTFTYRGVIGWLGEWQFAHFRRFFPLATISLITFVLVVPLLVLLLARSSRQRTGKLLRQEPKALIARAEHAVRDLMGAALFVAMISGLLGGYALWVYWIGDTSGKPIPLGSTIPATGAMVSAHGSIRYDRLASYESGDLLFQRDVQVVPVVETGNLPIRLFVQVHANAPAPAQAGTVAGFMDGEGMPGPLARLYQDAGYTLSAHPMILYESIYELRRPYLQAAGTLLIVSMVLAVAGLFERRWLNTLRRQFAGGGKSSPRR